jgi:hypothetical protein
LPRAARLLPALSVLLCPLPRASAGPLETLRAVAFRPGDPATFAAVYNEAGGGLLITRDGGQHFGLTCMTAISGETEIGRRLPSVVWTPDGHLLVATFSGVFRDDGMACGFSRIAELGDQYVSELVTDPDQPGILYALTSTGGAALNTVYRSLDQGLSWTPLFSPENVYFRRLRIVRLPDGRRRMVFGVAKPRSDQVTLDTVLRVSDDEGQTFVEHTYPDAADMRLLGVDGADPSRVYAQRVSPDGMSRTILMNPALGDPTAWLELGQVQDVGSFVTPPGGGFFLVDLGMRQLLRGDFSSEPYKLSLVDGADVTCFEENPAVGQFYSCASSRLRGADAAGAAAEPALLDFNELDAMVDCPGRPDLAASCLPQLDYGWCGATHFPGAPLCLELHAEPAPPGDAGTLPDAGSEQPSAKSSGCAISPARPSQPASPWRWLVLTAGLWLSRRGTRRKARALNDARRDLRGGVPGDTCR